jgi:hypothetical protein
MEKAKVVFHDDFSVLRVGRRHGEEGGATDAEEGGEG